MTKSESIKIVADRVMAKLESDFYKDGEKNLDLVDDECQSFYNETGFWVSPDDVIDFTS